MSKEFRYLFSPLQIGPIRVRNRLFSTGHGEGMVLDSLPRETLAFYHAEKAKGGIGLTIMGQSNVYPEPKLKLQERFSRLVSAYDPRVVPGWRQIADMVHEHGGKIFAQMGLFGAWFGGISASAIPNPAGGRQTTRALTQEAIREIIDYYGKCAAHAREAGLDGVEVHDHGGLVTQFLSPLWNKRSDEYGGSVRNRMRFLLEALSITRERAGAGLAVGYRLNADELLPGGLTLEDNQEIASLLVETGLVDFLDIDLATEPQTIHVMIAPLYVQPGYQVYAAAAIKEAIRSKVPVFVVGRIVDPIMAEDILANGQADLVGMTRAHICDPEIANKAREGRLDDIRPCLGDIEGCAGAKAVRTDVGCTYNPAVGREKEWGIGTLRPATTSKRVVVVGGGPAGMEVARTAALRGHKVVLYEKTERLGGQINLGAMLPGREEMLNAVRWYDTQLKKAGVEVVLGIEATKEMVVGARADAVVIATGATFRRDGFSAASYAPVPGWDQQHVVGVEDALLGRVTIGDRVVIYDDFGTIEAAGLAERLADQGKQVQILTKSPVVGMDLAAIMHFPYVYQRLFEKGVKLVPNTLVTAVGAREVVVRHVYSGESSEIEADTVVFVTAKLQDDALYHALEGAAKELYCIGDCSTPFNIQEAVVDGHRVGRLL